uniref:Putative ribonuclease H-like domain-containing protein n=1 Tax=Tanacetum cinerariifolium TaxID=118510 RepID=A0A6L2JYH8_TANCI|nr:putative ribonuclease H-like domain-containing protein [Tanacetum cinerariifolium]
MSMRTRRDRDGGVIILPSTTAKEHIAIQRGSKARTTLLQSIPNDHVADFYYMDDARVIWNVVKARIGEAEGLHKRYDRMQKIMSQLNQLKAKPDDEDSNLKFLRALPSSWSQVALTLKTKEQQLAYEDFEQIEKLDLEEMDLKWKMALLFVRVHKFEQKSRRKINFDKKESNRFNKKNVRCNKYHDDQSDEVITAKEFGMIAGCDSEDASKKGAAKIYNLIIGADTEEASNAGDAGELALMGVTFEVHNYPFSCDNKYNELYKQFNELNEKNGKYFKQVQAYKNSLKTLEKQKRVLQRNQLTLEEKIRVLSIELENTSNLLKHSKKINADVETTKKDLQTKLDNHLVQTKKWKNSSKNLFRLIDSSMSIRTKVGLGFNDCIRENELGWDDPAFSVFTTNSKDVEGRPLFHSATHLIKDYDFYKKQMANKNVNIPLARPQPVPVGKPKVFAPVPTGRQNRPLLIHTDRGYSPSVSSGLWKTTKDEGIFDSRCSRSMTGNNERLDDFQAFQGGKVTFGEHKDETYPILKDFINLVENQLNKKVKAIRCDNGTEFKNAHMIDLYGSKGIKREYSTSDTNSDSDCDEQVTIVPSYPSHNIHRSETKDTSGDEVDDSPFHFADEIFQKELARLKGQEQRATFDAKSLGLGCANNAEELKTQASAKIILTGSIPFPTGSIPVPAGDIMVSIDDVLVHISSSTTLIFNDEPTTRFPCPLDLGNHDPLPGIFSYSSYDDEFDAALNNVATSIEVSPVATKRINTIHPQSLILEDPTSAVQTRSKVLVDLLEGKDAIRTKWILKNKRDARGIVVRNKARLTDVKSAYLYERINEEVYVTQPKGLWILNIPRRSTRSTKKAWCDEFEALMKGEFQMSAMGELTFFLGSLMYLIASRPDIMFAVSACFRNQVTPTTSNLEVVKKIFMYLKGQPKLGLWYPKESPFMLEAYSDSDYTGANKDRKSTTDGC